VFSWSLFYGKANAGTQSWRNIYVRTEMERAGKTTIFPGDESLISGKLHAKKYTVLTSLAC